MSEWMSECIEKWVDNEWIEYICLNGKIDQRIKEGKNDEALSFIIICIAEDTMSVW